MSKRGGRNLTGNSKTKKKRLRRKERGQSQREAGERSKVSRKELCLLYPQEKPVMVEKIQLLFNPLRVCGWGRERVAYMREKFISYGEKGGVIG